MKLFKSHCAPDKVDWNFPEKMTVKDLKRALSELGQSSTGKKSVLCSRLRLAQKAVKSNVKKEKIQVGVNHIKHEMRSAKYAAKNKQKAGEKRNVEHVALEDGRVCGYTALEKVKPERDVESNENEMIMVTKNIYKENKIYKK